MNEDPSDDQIMISALEHYSYCPRQCALIHQEQTFDENLYTLRGRAVHEQVEGVGLDPQMGFLHALRPGRPALGLDLMEELRPVIAERLVLTLINSRQITASHFVMRPGGAVSPTDDGRKEVIVAYQKRKQEEIQLPIIERKVPIGLIPHVQARLLARVLRGDMEDYLPFLYR